MRYYRDFHAYRDKVDEVEYKKKLYSNDILSFDIETSSAWLQDGNVIGYRKGESEKYWNSLTPMSLCYIWQFGYNDEVYYGRELTDFRHVLEELPSDINFIIYIHNLSFEFQFLSDIFEWKTVFARSAHKVMKCIPKDFPNVEFRCSYFLTRLSLDAWGKELGFPKLHTLDYDIVRTPNTVLDVKELAYCERDIEVMYKGLQIYRDRYGIVADIPMTQTGEVRRDVKEILTNKKGWLRQVARMSPHSVEDYKRLFNTFMGGYTHANYTLAGRIVGNTSYCDASCDGVSCWDFASSYPYVLFTEKYPMSVFYRKKFCETKTDEYAYLLEVKFKRIESTRFNHYISFHKCYDTKNVAVDNGRVISADELTIRITDVDFYIIKNSYSFKEEDCIILESFASKKAYLPREFLLYMLELYSNKTRYKGVEDKADIYSTSKQKLNALFGMSCTALVQENYTYNADALTPLEAWTCEVKTADDIQKWLDGVHKFNYGKIFMSYAWGVWCCAYGRRNLWECIWSLDNPSGSEYNPAGKKGYVNAVIYCDTDSIKARGLKHDFTWYNDRVIKKLKASCDKNDIPFELCAPKNPKGKECILGIFEREDDASEYITLGAKRYCYRTAHDNKLHITIAGVNKGAVACLHDDIRNFHDGMAFDKDDDNVTMKLLHYIEKQPLATVWNKGKDDEYMNTYYQKGINMCNRGYKLSLKGDYALLLGLPNTSQSIFR